MGCQVHFACAAQKNEHCVDLHDRGVEEHVILLNDSSFDNWVKTLRPDIVIFDRYTTEEQFGWRVEKAVPSALRVLDTSDLHCLREARRKQLNTGETLDLFNDTALREIASIYRSDLTLIISTVEMRILEDHFSLTPPLVTQWPFMVDPQNIFEGPRFSDRKHCVLIGSFMHPPNVDAVRWSIEEIWPRVRHQMPDAEFHTYGSYSERFQAPKGLENKGVFIKGCADDVLETLAQYRVNLAPLRYGAGLKGKVLHGFQANTPVVGTPIVFEGIAEPSECAGCAELDAQKIADQVVRLLQHEQAFTDLHQVGLAILKLSDLRKDCFCSDCIW